MERGVGEGGRMVDAGRGGGEMMEERKRNETPDV